MAVDRSQHYFPSRGVASPKFVVVLKAGKMQAFPIIEIDVYVGMLYINASLLRKKS